MADEATSAAAPAEPVEQQAPQAQPAERPLGENGEKALKAERDARKAAEKSNADLLAKIKEFEDRDKTESERQADRLAALEKSNRDLNADKARYEAALKHGLSMDDLALLGPGDDIAERAERLAQRLAAAPVQPQNLPASPNAGREAQQPSADTEYEQYKQFLFPSNQQ